MTSDAMVAALPATDAMGVHRSVERARELGLD
jgi:hypothetical protein